MSAVRRGLFLMAAVPVVLSACAGSGQREVVVLAAASLTDVVPELGREFERLHEGTAVVFSLAGSQQLAGQILSGVDADVFLPADEAQLERVGDQLTGPPVVFARNRLVLVVEAGNPHGIAELSDLARPGLIVVLPAPEVPAGSYARAALDRAGVAVRPASLESDVRAVLARVSLGEADAGIVYATDAAASPSADAIPLPGTPAATYRAAVLSTTGMPATAEAFRDFLRSPAAQRILVRHGFAAP